MFKYEFNLILIINIIIKSRLSEAVDEVLDFTQLKYLPLAKLGPARLLPSTQLLTLNNLWGPFAGGEDY